MTPRRSTGSGSSTGSGTPVGAAGRRRKPVARPQGTLVDFTAARISAALPQRQRYQYVKPRVLAQAGPQGQAGWCIVSPNCSRNIDPEGGEINIAWLLAAPDNRWDLLAFDHGQAQWHATARGLPLADALALVCDDPQRIYWP